MSIKINYFSSKLQSRMGEIWYIHASGHIQKLSQ